MRKLSEEWEDRRSDHEDLKLAQGHLEAYVDSIINEYKVRKENELLISKLDEMIGEMRDMKSELTEVKKQSGIMSEILIQFSFTRQNITVNLPTNAADKLKNTAGAVRAEDFETTSSIQSRTNLYEELAAHFGTQAAIRSTQDILNPPNPPRVDQAETFPPPVNNVTPKPPPAPIPNPIADIEEPRAIIPRSRLAAPAKREKKISPVKIISNVLFYMCLAMLIVGAVSFAQSEDVNKSLFGFRYYYIKTDSMTPVLPVGSIVITKVTDPNDIKVGDDITVYLGDGSAGSYATEEIYLTHRVVEITTDDKGELSFRTKGVNNKTNDPAPFNAKLLVGKVIFCVPILGTVMTFIQSQLLFVIIMLVLIVALSFVLRMLFGKDNSEENPEKGNTESGGNPVHTAELNRETVAVKGN